MKQSSAPPVSATFLKCSYCRSYEWSYTFNQASGSCCPVLMGLPESTFIYRFLFFWEFLKEQLFPFYAKAGKL